MRNKALFITSLVSGFLMLTSAMAADAPVQKYVTDDAWKIIVSPYVWGASLHGRAELGGYRTDVNVPFSEIFDNLDMAVMGNIELARGPLGFYVDAQYVSTSQDENLRAHEIALKMKTTMVAGGMFYRIYEKELGGLTIYNEPQRFAIEPTLGVRWTRLKADLASEGYHISRKTSWTDPFFGVRVRADLNERWNLSAEADIGGFSAGTKMSYNAQGYLGYRTFLFDRPTMLRFGYRALSQDFKESDFMGHPLKWDVVQHGPVIGLSMRF
ncbi:hypothetical protein [Pseudochrobactrum sp. HB0163]|uniref:hypothetical protein n=1 Tax=Pseudochrobactrum sp. HB0163 TaxID=3450708 RepID=UPI003F6DBFF2